MKFIVATGRLRRTSRRTVQVIHVCSPEAAFGYIQSDSECKFGADPWSCIASESDTAIKQCRDASKEDLCRSQWAWVWVEGDPCFSIMRMYENVEISHEKHLLQNSRRMRRELESLMLMAGNKNCETQKRINKTKRKEKVEKRNKERDPKRRADKNEIKKLANITCCGHAIEIDGAQVY